MPPSLQGGCGRAEGRPGKSANRFRSTLNNELIFLLGLALDRLDVVHAAAIPMRAEPTATWAGEIGRAGWYAWPRRPQSPQTSHRRDSYRRRGRATFGTNCRNCSGSAHHLNCTFVHTVEN